MLNKNSYFFFSFFFLPVNLQENISLLGQCSEIEWVKETLINHLLYGKGLLVNHDMCSEIDKSSTMLFAKTYIYVQTFRLSKFYKEQN